METTVTGLFADEARLDRACDELTQAGFGTDDIVRIDRETEGLHELLGAETSDAARGAAVGAVVGAVGAAAGAIALSVPPIALLAVHWVLSGCLGAVFGGAGGTLIGLLIGSATGHQVRDEYEHGIERGGRVLAVNTDRDHAARALDLLRRCGGEALSTAVHRRHHAPGSA